MKRRRKEKKAMKKVEILSDEENDNFEEEAKEKEARRRRVLNRWRLWYTLIKNPQLRQYRRKLQDDEQKEGSWATYSKKERKALLKAFLKKQERGRRTAQSGDTPLATFSGSSSGKAEYRLYRDDDDDDSDDSSENAQL